MSVNNPTLSTTPDQTSVTLGPPVTLKDTADLEGGSNPTGSITFTLVGPDGTTDLDTVMVWGLASTPPFPSTALTRSGPQRAGTYQSNATHSREDNIISRSAVNPPVEQEPINPNSPTLSTIPDQTSV